ncbi:MAG: hypothetical protein EBU66_19785 [Bacteroidetes bacterium]|jgi:hypothetical protein|nr:hypothetical protein [bacterium]NBP66873.1 hypothetical protein [Bacteroidota bacterium]
MITDYDLAIGSEETRIRGHVRSPLVWVIDTECVYDSGINHDYVYLFTDHDEVIDVSNEYPDHSEIAVRFLKNGNILEDLCTSEYFGSILLSNPTVVDQRDYPYGHWVIAPYAKFDGEKFIIFNQDGSPQDMSTLSEWDITNENHPEYKPIV